MSNKDPRPTSVQGFGEGGGRENPEPAPLPGWFLTAGRGDEWTHAQCKYFEEYDEVFWRPIRRDQMLRPQVIDHKEIKGLVEHNHDKKVRREREQIRDRAWRAGADEAGLDHGV